MKNSRCLWRNIDSFDNFIINDKDADVEKINLKKKQQTNNTNLQNMFVRMVPDFS